MNDDYEGFGYIIHFGVGGHSRIDMLYIAHARKSHQMG